MDLKPLFEPKTMAVIGVSAHNYFHPANIIYTNNLFRHQLPVYAVNPKAGVLKGQQTYASIKDVPDEIDLAVIVVQADRVHSVMQECIECGVKGAIIISGGFAEVGRTDLQQEIIDIGREANFPFIGPNCIGVNVPGGVNSFFELPGRLSAIKSGNLGLISQSGGVLADMILRFSSENIGISSCVSIGNKALIKEKEILDYLGNHVGTKVIAFYLEGFGENEGKDFLEAAKACGKPVIVLKSGKTLEGARAVSSHTACLAGNYELFASALKQYGLVEAFSMQELVYYGQALSMYQTHIQGNIGIVTGSGGHGTLAVDLAKEYGMNVPMLEPYQRDMVKSSLSPSVQPIATLTNPIDVTGSAVDSDFVGAARSLMMMDNIDCVVVLALPYMPGVSIDLGGMLGIMRRSFEKPLIAYVPRLEKYGSMVEGFEFNGVPVAHSVEGALKMAQGLVKNKAIKK